MRTGPGARFSSGMRRHSVSHLAVFSVSIPSSSASTCAATAEGARPITDPGPCSSSQAALSPAMVVDFPLPAGPTRTSSDAPGGGDLLHGEGLVDAQSVVASGQVRLGNVRDCRRAHPNGSVLSPGFEEAIFGLEEDLCGVDEVVPRLQARGPVRADVTLRGVVHRRRCEHDRSARRRGR